MSGSKNQDLQLIRGIAILLVVFCHLSLPTTLIKSVHQDLSNPFWWGVELFFVLSGFVVTRSIRSKNFDPLYFVIKRIFRLYPAIIFLLICAALINTVIYKSTYSGYIIDIFSVAPKDFQAQSLAILGGYLNNLPGPISYQYGQMWSLSVEFQFYAFFALLLIVFFPLNNVNKIKIIVFLAAIILGSVFIYRLAIGFGLTTSIIKNISYLARYKFDFLAAGVLLAFIPTKKIRERLSPLSNPIFPFAALLSTSILLALLPSPISSNTTAKNYLDSIGMIFTLITSTYMVALGSISGFEKGKFTRKIRFLLIRIGDYSYTIYLTHLFVIVLSWIFINHTMTFAFSSPIYYGLSQLFIVALLSVPFVNFCYYQIELRGVLIANKVEEILHNFFRKEK